MSIYPDDQALSSGEREVGLEPTTGKFTAGNPASNPPLLPSRFPPETINLVLDLLSEAIENANGSVNNTDSTQLFNAVNTLAVTRFSEEYTKNKAKQEDFNANNDTKYITSKLLRANNSGTQIGQLGEFIQDKNNLPSGWYLCDGRPFASGTSQFTVLDSLPTSIKTAWNIQKTGDPGNRYLPDFFLRKDSVTPPLEDADSRLGFGLFARQGKEDGSDLGKVEEDALQNLIGSVNGSSGGVGGIVAAAGIFKTTGGGNINPGFPGNPGRTTSSFEIDLSGGGVRADIETRPMNIGVSKVLFLGI